MYRLADREGGRYATSASALRVGKRRCGPGSTLAAWWSACDLNVAPVSVTLPGNAHGAAGHHSIPHG